MEFVGVRVSRTLEIVGVRVRVRNVLGTGIVSYLNFKTFMWKSVEPKFVTGL